MTTNTLKARDDQMPLPRDLRSPAPRRAILPGWASELPVLVQMNELHKNRRPKSGDPDFLGGWSGYGSDGRSMERKVDRKVIADDWQQISAPTQEHHLENDNE